MLRHNKLMMGLVVALLSAGTAHAGKFSVLWTFQPGGDGEFPAASLLLSSSGVLYGTAGGGGTYNAGAVFEVTETGTESVVYSFGAYAGDGNSPVGSLIADSSGNLYGTTNGGGQTGSACFFGSDGCGTIFKLAPDGSESVLYSFCSQANCADGGAPEAGLLLDSTGNLYGTTYLGGTGAQCANGSTYGCGTVFKLAPNGTESVLYSFTGGADGANPNSTVVMDTSGNLYGTAYQGGIDDCSTAGLTGCGTVFEISTGGTESTLHTFCSQTACTDGASPWAGLAIDASGNLYGTTINGGTNNDGPCFDCGVVFKLAPGGAETVLHAFYSRGDGEVPFAPVILDRNGNLFGTTAYGGKGHGTIFEISAGGTEKVLHALGVKTGYRPYGGLVEDGSGYLYGTTVFGGDKNCNARGIPSGCGTVFKLKS